MSWCLISKNTASCKRYDLSCFDSLNMKNIPADAEYISLRDRFSFTITNVSSFEGAENLPKELKYLDITGTRISSFKGTEKLPRSLKKLIMDYMPEFTSFEGVENLPQGLEVLVISSKRKICVKGIENLPQGLKELTIEAGYRVNHINSFHMIKNLPPNLKHLNLYNNIITSFDGAEFLPKSLEILDLRINEITSFKGCEKLPRGLKNLKLENNFLTSFEYVENLPQNLKELDLACNFKFTSYEKAINLPRSLICLYPPYFSDFCLDYIKELQFKSDFQNCLDEIYYNPRLERMKSKLVEEQKIYNENPEKLLELIQ